MFVDHVQMGDWPFGPSIGLGVLATYSYVLPFSRWCRFANLFSRSRIKYVMPVSPLQIAWAGRGLAESRQIGAMQNETNALVAAITRFSSP